MVKFLTVIYRFNEIAINTPMAFFRELENTTIEFIWKHRRSWIAKIIPGKNNSGGIIIPEFHHTIYRAIVTKPAFLMSIMVLTLKTDKR